MQCAKRFTVTLLGNRWKNVYVDPLSLWGSPIAKYVHTSRASLEFHEFDKRSGYNTGLEIADTRTERIRMGLKQLKKEIKLWKQEMKEVLECDPILDYRAGTLNFLKYLI